MKLYNDNVITCFLRLTTFRCRRFIESMWFNINVSTSPHQTFRRLSRPSILFLFTPNGIDENHRIINCKVISASLKTFLSATAIALAPSRCSSHSHKSKRNKQRISTTKRKITLWVRNFIESYCVKITDIPIHLINQIKDQSVATKGKEWNLSYLFLIRMDYTPRKLQSKLMRISHKCKRHTKEGRENEII